MRPCSNTTAFILNLKSLILPILQLISLGVEPELVDKDVGVGSDSGDAAGHVVVNLVDLLGGKHLVQQLVGVLPLRRQENAIFG